MCAHCIIPIWTLSLNLYLKKIHHASAISYILEKGKLRYTETKKFAQVSQKQVAES